MKNRKKGFSLVELLIVLAVMAALIATITPVALNAIKKSKATQVAQNLKTLASALENAAYVNGIDTTTGNIKNATGGSIALQDLGRDIKSADYAIYYTGSGGTYTANIVYKGEGDIGIIDDTLAQATTKTFNDVSGSGFTPLTGDDWTTPTNVINYQIVFTVY